MALYSGGDEDIYPFNGCCGHGRSKRKRGQNYKIANTDLKCRQPEPETGPPWQIGMQIHKFMIFNSASDIQTYLYAAGQTQETSGKKKQRSRAEGEESDDEGGDPDSDRSFTLAALDSQSFMRKITLRISPATISQNCTELQFSDIVLLFRKPLSFQAWPNEVQHRAYVVIPSSHYSWKT